MGMNGRLLRPRQSGFNPRSISGLALWLDAADSQTLYTTDAGPVAAVASPLDIATPALWLDGADSSAASMTLNGSLVETWKDKSNSENNVTASGGLRPTLTGNALNSRSVVTFGGSQGLTGNLAASITNNAYSVFVVCRISGAITNGRVFSTAGAGNDFGSGSVIPCVSNSGTLSAFAGTQGTNASGVTGFASYGVFAGVLSSNLVTNSAGGMSVASAAATLSTAVTRLGVGVAAQGGTGFNTCDIAEIILYPTALTTAQRASVESYLAAKWGISGVHAPATATSDPVGYWGDKSGNARHAVQATAGNRPRVQATGMNGRRSVQFFGGNAELLSLGDLSAVFPSAGEIVVAFEPLSDTSYGLYETRSNSSYFRNANGLSYFGTLSTGRQAGIAVSMPSTGRHIAALQGVASGSTQAILLDNAQVFAGAMVGGYGAGNAHVIGNNNNAAADTGLTGYVSEILAFPRILTTSERRLIHGYLASKWGITLAPQVSNADAQNWINRVYANGGTVSATTASAVNTFCESIDSAGIRDRFYRLNLFCGASNASLDAVRTPLYRGPSLSGTQFGNTTDTNNLFVAGDYAETGTTGGLKGNASTKYLDTGLAMTFLGTNQVHMFVSFNPEAAELRALLAARINLAASMALEGNYNGTTANRPRVALFSSGNQPTDHCSPITGRTQYLVNYDGSQPVLALGRNVSLNNVNNAGAYSGTNTESFLVFAGTQTGTGVTAHSGQRIDAYSVGAAFTSDAQRTAFHNAMAAFRTALGRT